MQFPYHKMEIKSHTSELLLELKEITDKNKKFGIIVTKIAWH